MDGFVKIAKKILGRPTCIRLFQPYAKAAMSAIVDVIQDQTGGMLSEENALRVQALGAGLSQFIVGNGLRPFMSKWIRVVEGVPLYKGLPDVYNKVDEVFEIDHSVIVKRYGEKDKEYFDDEDYEDD